MVVRRRRRFFRWWPEKEENGGVTGEVRQVARHPMRRWWCDGFYGSDGGKRRGREKEERNGGVHRWIGIRVGTTGAAVRRPWQPETMEREEMVVRQRRRFFRWWPEKQRHAALRRATAREEGRGVMLLRRSSGGCRGVVLFTGEDGDGRGGAGGGTLAGKDAGEKEGERDAADFSEGKEKIKNYKRVWG
ncbi:hypothetical protein HAX54_038973 [Datura stramonium]|uniref:Uncharacterized protein n=1 Tax=Datura stramonium TaxID=4076 RepID=A0ABS8SIS4_DATST|nr:hypothetical protein [Datura stramonium]